jgi:transposase
MEKRNRRYSREFIFQIMAALDAGISRQDICEKYNIPYRTLADWLPRYASEEFLKKRKPSFNEQQRRSIVRSILEGRMTRKEASLAHGVTVATVRQWIKQSKQDNPDIDIQKVMATPNEQNLLKALQASQLKVSALETMIDIAEKDFKINIRKKPGAKQ